ASEPGSVLTFDVEGMTCAACSNRVERVLSRQEGVDAASVNLAGRSATVRVGDTLDPTSLAEAVRKIGYELRLRDPAERRPNLTEAYDADTRAQWGRFWVASALSLPLMVLAMAVPHSQWNEVVQWILATPVLFWAGWQFHKT